MGENDVFGDIKIIVFLSNRYLRNRLVFQFNYLQLQKSCIVSNSDRFVKIKVKKKWNRGRKKESETNGSLEAKI